jgi:hypothetical protein
MTIDLTTIDWKVILGTIAVIITLFGLFYFQWWRNRRRLSYQVLSNLTLISREGEIRDKIEIRYEGEPVEQVGIIEIKLINDGYLPIRKEEFEKPIEFIFSEAKILNAEKVKVFPENLTTVIAYNNERLAIDPVLFNRKEYIHFRVLLTPHRRDFKIDSRIVGINELTKAKRNTWPYEFALSGATSLVLFLGMNQNMMAPHPWLFLIFFLGIFLSPLLFRFFLKVEALIG